MDARPRPSIYDLPWTDTKTVPIPDLTRPSERPSSKGLTPTLLVPPKPVPPRRTGTPLKVPPPPPPDGPPGRFQWNPPPRFSPRPIRVRWRHSGTPGFIRVSTFLVSLDWVGEDHANPSTPDCSRPEKGPCLVSILGPRDPGVSSPDCPLDQGSQDDVATQGWTSLYARDSGRGRTPLLSGRLFPSRPWGRPSRPKIIRDGGYRG